MKQVTKYQSDSGFLFDTAREAEQEDEKFAHQREVAKYTKQSIYIYQPAGIITIGGANGGGRKVY
jgi:hypothetical protein